MAAGRLPLRSTDTIDDLTPPERQRAEHLHSEAIVWNALDSTNYKHADREYLGKLRRSGVTAFNHTVAMTENLVDALDRISTWLSFYDQHQSDTIRADTLEDVYRAKDAGKVAVFFGTQGISCLDERLSFVRVYRELGVRFLQPTYEFRSAAGDGCSERYQSGLSQFGLKLVEECNRLGIALDLSHVGTGTTLDTIEHSRVPVFITHAGVKAMVDAPRNHGDDEIRALAAKGGVIGIAGKSGLLRQDGLTAGTTIDDYVDAVDYVRDLVGIDYVGIGTDVGDERKYTVENERAFHEKYPLNRIIGDNLDVELMHPLGLRSPSQLYNITAGLVRRGYSDGDVKKVIGGNMMRALQVAWEERTVP